MKYISYPFGIPPERKISSSKETFLRLDNIVQCLFDNGHLNDIECRKIVVTKEVVTVRAAIYSVITTKKSTAFKNILQALRSKIHPLQNPKILERIFSSLKYHDLENCKRVCEDWKEVADSLVVSKYDEINREQLLLDKLIAKRESIKTNQECNIRKSREKQAAVFQLMVSLNPESDETLLAMLQTQEDFQMNIGYISNYESILDPSENIIAKALSNQTVLSITLEFLSLQDIKSFRVVCRSWNSVAEPFLRKRSIIHFKRSFGPLNFINVSKYSSLPDLHFTAFKFGREFPLRELTEFFTKFGRIVKSLNIIPRKGIRLCLSYTSNLSEVHLLGKRTIRQAISTDMMIPWNKLQSVNILRLSNMILDADEGYTRITPAKVHLDNVQFKIDGNRVEEILLNNFVDFGKAKDVKINGSPGRIQSQVFDWAKDTFNAERISLANIRCVNAQTSKSSAQYLKLNGRHPLCEKTNMEIKELIFEDGTLQLSAIPPSVEKLAICEDNFTTIVVSQPFQLPNLKHLSYQKESEFNLLSYFRNCHNLNDLEIIDCNVLETRWLPKSVKRLKVQSDSGPTFLFGPTEDHFDLNLLVLCHVSMQCLKNLHFDRIRPKILVLQLESSYKDKTFLPFLGRNQQIEKIYVQFRRPMQSSDFKRSRFFRLVDKESAYYEFSNGRGRSITLEEFYAIKSSVDIITTMKGMWNSDELEHQSTQQVGFNNNFQVEDANDGSDHDDDEEDEQEEDADENGENEIVYSEEDGEFDDEGGYVSWANNDNDDESHDNDDESHDSDDVRDDDDWFNWM